MLNDDFNSNPDQQAIIDSKEGIFVAIAGPGSGKSTTLIRRHLTMLLSGIPNSDMLSLTFTNAAAVELVKKAGILDCESVFRTFHSFAIELLKKEREYLPFKLCDTVIPVTMEDYKLLFELVKMYPAINNFRTLQEKISAWKCANVEPEEAVDQSRSMGIEYFYALAYESYEEKCREQGWLDFDSLMREAVNLLEENEEVRNRWKRKYLSIDEGQDCDDIQFRLLQLIFDGNVMIVGDENQCIFEWRSAKPSNLTNFSQKFAGAKTLFLGKNYRSTGRLVDFFKQILPVDNGLASHMSTDNDEGEPPKFIKYSDDYEEAQQVLASVTDPVNTAVIARTNRQLFTYQKICTVKGIKYKILGKKDFWEQNEIKKLLSLAKDSQDPRPADVVLTDLIQRHNLLNLYKHSGKPMESSPIENLNDIVKMSAKKGTVQDFLNYLRKLTYARRSVKGLTLSTVHQSKGREFENVFVVGVSQGKMPHKDGELAEERRIFFVACSRAAKQLTISFSGSPSMFLNDYKDEIKMYLPSILIGA